MLLIFGSSCGSKGGQEAQDASADEDAGRIILGDAGKNSARDGAISDAPREDADTGAADARAEASCGACGEASACCPTGCANLQSDTKNCGACGHDCALGACSGGVCQPYALVSQPNLQENDFIAFDGVNVAFGDQGTATVAQIPVVGGGLVKLASVGSYGVGIGAGNVFYVANAGSSLRFDVATEGVPDSGTVQNANLSSGWVPQVAVPPNGQVEFFVQQHVPNFAFYVASAGTLQSPFAGTGPAFPAQIVADAAHAFFGEPSTGKIWSYSIANKQTSAIVTGQLQPDYVALDGTYLYWANAAPAIERVLASGGPQETVLSPLPTPATGLASDGKYVYFAAGALVYYAPAGGGGSATTLFAKTNASNSQVLTGGGYVVWLDANDFTVFAVRAPL